MKNIINGFFQVNWSDEFWRFEGDGWTALWDPYGLRLFYLDPLFEQKIIREYYQGGKDVIHKNYPELTLKKISTISIIPEIYAMKLIVTNRCNLSCSYCFIDESLNIKSSIQNDMTKDVAKISLNEFAKHLKYSTKQKGIINIYGGEPLLVMEIVEYVIRETRKMEFKGLFDREIDIVIETNGVLLNEYIANIFSEYKVTVVVSIDGPKEIHDKARFFTNKQGSWGKAYKGFQQAQNAGATTVASAVLNNNNLDHIKDLITFIRYNLNCTSLGVNMQHPKPNGKFANEINSKKLSEIYIELLELGGKYGVYIEQAFRRLRPFVEQTFRYRDCPSAGSRIVVRPDGMTSVCEAVCMSEMLDLTDIRAGSDLRSNKQFIEWYKRTSLSLNDCKDCPAIGLCGGGCPFNALVIHGSIWKIDTRFCEICIAILRWAIINLAKELDILKKIELSNGYYFPTLNDRRRLYGCAPVNSKSTPLWSYTSFVEQKREL